MRKPVTVALVSLAVTAAVAATAVQATAASHESALAPMPQGTTAPPPGDDPTLTVSPPSGPAGTTVTISNSNSCFGGSATATVVLHDPSNQTASQSDVDGGWSVQIVVAPGTPPDTYQVSATCTGADEQPADYSYTPNQFTVTGTTTSPTPSPSATSSPTATPTPSRLPLPAPSPTAPVASAVAGEANFTG